MFTRKFQKKVENFTCARCGYLNTGDGYTNHCKKCLHSMHVDVYPGDRSASCGALMKPVTLDYFHGEYRLLHKCMSCGFERANKLGADDSFEVALELTRSIA